MRLLFFFLFSFSLMALELPNSCSKDKNPNEFTIISYHEIADKSETLDPTYAVSAQNFKSQMEWLISNGFHFISIDDVLKFRLHKKALPPKAVLITFDDGYRSVYDNAFPVVKQYKIPVVVALVGSWLVQEEKVDFDGHIMNRDKFLTKENLREMVDSGLVEIASHTYDSHRGIVANPQNNMQPAMVARLYKNGKYETDVEYERRIYADLLKNNQFLESYTGRKPRIMVWPYGSYNAHTTKIAKSLGMPVGLTLDDGSNTKKTPLVALRRILAEQTMTTKELELQMWLRNQNFIDDGRATKAVHVDLDYVYDKDPAQQERNLGALIERIKSLGVNTVYLQAFADPDANGAADFVYFPNRHIPLRADLFNRTAWQISKRTQVKRLYAWMPMLAWQFPSSSPKEMVKTLSVDKTHLNMGYPRVSPFSKKNREVIKEIYEDLAKTVHLDGLIFHDDITLSDFEDDSTSARREYKKWGLPADVLKIRADKQAFLKWSNKKVTFLDDFAMELFDIVKQQQPELKSARNLYAQVALNQYAPEWYGQSLRESIKRYDYTAIMAMPYMEQAEDSKKFYDDIIANVKKEECGIERVVMELQSANWRSQKPLSGDEMKETIGYMYKQEVDHVAYYPDDFFHNNPDAKSMKEAFSVKSVKINRLNKLLNEQKH